MRAKTNHGITNPGSNGWMGKKGNIFMKRILFVLLGILLAACSSIPTSETITLSPAVSEPIQVNLITLRPVKQYGDIFAFGELDLKRQEYGDFNIHSGHFPASIFAPAPSVLEYQLDGAYSRFQTRLMLAPDCAYAEKDGSFFVIMLDNVVAYRSPQITDKMEPVFVDLDITGVDLLRLDIYSTPNIGVVDPNGGCDGSIWGDPVLFAENQIQPTATSATLVAPKLPSSAPGEIMAEYFVSPEGSDANPGTIDEPFATIQYARDVVRTINQNMTGPIHIYLRDGTYRLTETLEFGENDSGTNGYDIVYQAYPEEAPIISGGIQLNGFQEVKDQPYWIMEIPSEIETFRNLYVNDHRAQRAQTEFTTLGIDFWKGDWSDRDGIMLNLDGADWWVSDWTDYAPSKKIISPSTLPEFSRPQDLEIHWNMEWMDIRVPVENILSLPNDQEVIVMKQPFFSWAQSFRYIGWDNWPEPGGHWYEPTWDRPFYIENALELMDQPGEWYYNQDTHELYYYPMIGESPKTSWVVVPQVERLLMLQGTKVGQEVHNIQFTGITFAYSSWMRASQMGTASDTPEEFADGECALFCSGFDPAKGYFPSAVQLEHAREINFSKNTFTHLGAVGLGMPNNVSAVEITGNAFIDLSDAAIIMGRGHDQIILEKKNAKQVQDILINNNLVYQIGVEYWSAYAIIGRFVSNIEVSHNHVEEIPNSGITFSGYGFLWEGAPTTGVGNNNIVNNKVIRSSLRGVNGAPGIGGDAGAVYVDGNLDRSIIQGNYFSDVINQYACIYLDIARNNHMTVQQNVCERAPMWLASNLKSTTDLQIHDNYTTTLKALDFYTPTFITTQNPYLDELNDIHITNVLYYEDANWPAEAREIIANAGLEKDYLYLLDLMDR